MHSRNRSIERYLSCSQGQAQFRQEYGAAPGGFNAVMWGLLTDQASWFSIPQASTRSYWQIKVTSSRHHETPLSRGADSDSNSTLNISMHNPYMTVSVFTHALQCCRPGMLLAQIHGLSCQCQCMVYRWQGAQATPSFEASLESHCDWVNDLALVDELLFSCSADKTIKLWQADAPGMRPPIQASVLGIFLR